MASRWFEFLDVRAAVILEFFREGKSPDEIARILSMDGDQVLAIALALGYLTVKDQK